MYVLEKEKRKYGDKDQPWQVGYEADQKISNRGGKFFADSRYAFVDFGLNLIGNSQSVEPSAQIGRPLTQRCAVSRKIVTELLCLFNNARSHVGNTHTEYRKNDDVGRYDSSGPRHERSQFRYFKRL